MYKYCHVVDSFEFTILQTFASRKEDDKVDWV